MLTERKVHKNILRPLIASALFISVLLASSINVAPAMAESASPQYLQKVHDEIKAHHYQRAMQMLEVKAHAGCSYSQSLLGLMHQKGIGCKADPKEASHWFLAAAKNNFVDAQLQLGKLYSTASRNIAPEANQAKYWLTRAAEQGAEGARELIGHIPGGPELEYKVTKMRTDAAQTAAQGEQGLTQSWTGYANIVNTLNGASGQH
jgi:hypothetical protein